MTASEETRKEVENIDFLSRYSSEDKVRVIDAVKKSYQLFNRFFPEDEELQTKAVNEIIAKVAGIHVEQQREREVDEHGRVKIKRLNVYTDGKGFNFVTVDIHEGTTPMIIRHPTNGKQLKSLCYLVPQDLTPEGEWYKPTAEIVATMTKELQKHCFDGGLILRPYGAINADMMPIADRIKNTQNPVRKANILRAEIVSFLRSEGAEFDEADINLMYQDLDEKRFISWDFKKNNAKLEICLDYCDSDYEDDCPILIHKTPKSLDDFKENFYNKKVLIQQFVSENKIDEIWNLQE